MVSFTFFHYTGLQRRSTTTTTIKQSEDEAIKMLKVKRVRNEDAQMSTAQQTADAIAAALANYFTQAEVTFNLVAGVTEAKDYTDAQLLNYSDTAATTQLIADPS